MIDVVEDCWFDRTLRQVAVDSTRGRGLRFPNDRWPEERPTLIEAYHGADGNWSGAPRRKWRLRSDALPIAWNDRVG